MSAPRLPMRKIREVLRLKHERGLTHREVAHACSISIGAVTRRACGSCQRYGKRHRVCADSSVSACVSHTALDGARAAHKAPRGGAILAIKPTSTLGSRSWRYATINQH